MPPLLIAWGSSYFCFKQKETAALNFKAAEKWYGRVNRSALRRLFSFAVVRQSVQLNNWKIY